MEISYLFISVLIGATLDSFFGDPYSLPHPIRVFGNAIYYLNHKYNKGLHKKLKGSLVCIFLVTSAFLFFYFMNFLLSDFPNILCLWNAIFFYYGLSSHCLIKEGLKVENELIRYENGSEIDLAKARKALSMIVGRDTSELTPHKIRSAVLETLSENLSDGVVAPIFFFFIGGIPLMFAYKMINTLDSMIGYKNEKYKDFGFFSAKVDDIANFIPSRLTALLMCLVSLKNRIPFIIKYRHAHTSPNAIYPEAALAGILDCQLGGTNIYFGKIVEKEFIGNNPRTLLHKDVITTCVINAKVAFILYLSLAIYYF